MNAYIINIEVGINKGERHDCYAEGSDAEDAQDRLITALEAEGRIHGQIWSIRRCPPLPE